MADSFIATLIFPFWYHDQRDCRQSQDQLWPAEEGQTGRFDMGNIAQVLPKYQDGYPFYGLLALWYNSPQNRLSLSEKDWGTAQPMSF
jgi:hypothetical protein